MGQCVPSLLCRGCDCVLFFDDVLMTSSEGETIESVSYHLELLRLLVSCLPACKFGRSF